MIRRLILAFGIALVILALGITVRFGGPRHRVNVFFEMRGSVPEVRFRNAGVAYPAPVLFMVHDADPGALNERYRGAIAPVELVEVDIDDFIVDRYALFAELVPGGEITRRIAWGRSEPRLGGARLMWFTYFVEASVPGREAPQNYIVLGLGIDDPPIEEEGGARRYPAYYQVGRAAAIPIEFTGDPHELVCRSRGRLVLSEPIEDPLRATAIITVTFAPAATPEVIDDDTSEAAPPGAVPDPIVDEDETRPAVPSPPGD